MLNQVWIHTDFHRFTEIGQIFHNKILATTFNFPTEIWKMVWKVRKYPV